MKLIILSDIHANLEALKSVYEDIKQNSFKDYKICILGDVINYGLRPNETIEIIRKMSKDIDVMICGNHEMALFGFEDNRFSSKRGKDILDLTKKLLSKENYDFINTNFSKTFISKIIDGKKYLFVHGNLEDIFWGTLDKDNCKNEIYKSYDIIFSGHSHKPHYIEEFFSVNDIEYRDKKRTIFINPGSVGQPRNHSSQSQYVIFDTVTLEIKFCKVFYDIKKEQKIYDKYEVDDFYKNRLTKGI
ncbi:MAG: metallophosphoesterase family protein [Campylobacteraceae bacterium]|nr:metallophosphoesterase family protein [Campylobacteraceae bacterium]